MTANEILEHIRDLETELERHVKDKQHEWHYRLEAGTIRFEQRVRQAHRRLKQGLVQYLWDSPILTILSAPIIYSVLIPLVLVDLWISAYQLICFPIYRIPRVRRHDYIAIDRWHLAYLNGAEKFNCDYCSYANGLLAYLREITARTEQYWCPIKHARSLKGPHQRSRLFVEYGDASGYHHELNVLRKALSEEGDKQRVTS